MWMRWVGRSEGINIQHARNKGEMKIGKYKVDGICHETKQILEMNGCWWHACPLCFKNRDKIHPKLNMPMHEVYARTMEKKRFIRTQAEYTLIEMWECEWDAIFK